MRDWPSPDVSNPFCYDMLRAGLAALASLASPDSMSLYSLARNRFGLLARPPLASSRDESVCNIRARSR